MVFNHHLLVETERSQVTKNGQPGMRLRHWGSQDAGRLLELYVGNEDLHRQLPKLENSADAEAAISSFETSREDRAIFCIDVGGKACGLVGLSFEAKDEATNRFDRAWVWYWCAGEARGTGLMKLSVKTVCDWAMGKLDSSQTPVGFELLDEVESPQIRRLELGYRLNNPAYAKVAEYAGFTVEGVERSKFKINGELIDAAIAARL